MTKCAETEAMQWTGTDSRLTAPIPLQPHLRSCACACARVYVCVRARVRVCAGVCVCMLCVVVIVVVCHPA